MIREGIQNGIKPIVPFFVNHEVSSFIQCKPLIISGYIEFTINTDHSSMYQG
ncbi:hypothetical protein GCM10007906_26740 [Vibrio hyugaensis]|uniref:Uncharacterized protein n=1 Tax=Vibrio hyugaensis TaxID=1534743 RepID=A0ABQ5Y2E2_9VIBR|nr:hypothetical protein GCM10007906_26740 [Vibrio hyugaensis]